MKGSTKLSIVFKTVILCGLFACFSIYAEGQACDCPAVGSCAPCSGGLTSLTLRFNGILPSVITASDQMGIVFTGLVLPGGTFTFTGSIPNEKFVGPTVEVRITGILNATISTLCGAPIYVGFNFGSFTLVAGLSKAGGALCCAEAAEENIPPVISNCPANISVNLSTSSCTATVNWTAPTATDNCTVASFTSTHAPGAIFPVGITPVVYTAVDSYANTSTCSFNVTVNDVTNPVIAGCPANITLSANASCQAIATWTAPTATDNCSASLVGSHASGALFPVGTTPVTYTATDPSGNQTTCSFNVTVNDVTNPVIAGCPANIILSANVTCQAIATWTAPTATDNCSVSVTSTHNPGALFPVGITPVTYTATDPSGNKATCTFNVTVNDITNPVITSCPANIILSANASCQAIATWTAPTATDNCSVSVTSTHNPGALFPVGITAVTYTATDPSGNKATCSFNVTVNDITNPVIAGCPANITLSANASCQAIASWTAPTATDNCSATLTRTHSPGTLFPIGTTLVTYTATDPSGNKSTCSFNVTVNDITNPVITGCPANVTVSANASCQAIASWTAPAATDNCSVSVTSTHNPGTLFPIGTTPVTYTATDPSGNKATCTFNVTVNDVTNPVITGCPANIIVSANATCQAIASWTAPTATDNCSASLVSSHNPGALFLIGTTAVTYTATDPSGNKATCTFNVTVNDVTSPVITGCPANVIVSANASCQATASWTAPTALDNCSVSITSTHNPGALFSIGTTAVTYTATDPSGNKATCTFNVTVIDITNPVIAGCPSNITVTANASCQAIATWTAPTAADNCSASLTRTHNPGTLFPVGITVVTYTATDPSGNKTTCSFNVTVNDITNPVITGCPANITVTANASCEAIATWTAPTATDNCSVLITSTHNSGELFPFGPTAVTYTATDPSGNKATCSFNVTVIDDTDPVLTGCPANITASANASCQAIVSWTAPTATDNCSVSVISSHRPGDLFPLGTTTVTYTATDPSGNKATCSFDIVVTDTEVPVVTGCPSDITVHANGTCMGIATWTAPAATDNCSVPLISSTHAPGSTFPFGTTTVTYTVTDQKGNTATCSFNVIVDNANEPAVSGKPDDITLNADESGGVNVTWVEPQAIVVCGGVSTIQSHEPGTIFRIGTTIVTYEFIDDFGKSSSCTFHVNVLEPEALFAISNVVTPDGDGINDTWMLVNIEQYLSNSVLVIDRWGNKIYGATGYDNETVYWDGTKNGTIVPTGTYFYTIEVRLQDSVIQKKGFLEVIQ